MTKNWNFGMNKNDGWKKSLKEMKIKIKTLNENKAIEYKQTRMKFYKFQPFTITSWPVIMKLNFDVLP